MMANTIIVPVLWEGAISPPALTKTAPAMIPVMIFASRTRREMRTAMIAASTPQTNEIGKTKIHLSVFTDCD